MTQKLDASLSTLAMSIASAGVMAMGLAPDPTNGESRKDKEMARFNIDLLLMLKEKTKNNLQTDEQKFLDTLIQDLQMKFLQI